MPDRATAGELTRRMGLDLDGGSTAPRLPRARRNRDDGPTGARSVPRGVRGEIGPVEVGDEVRLAVLRPGRLAGAYGRVLEVDGANGEILVEVGAGLVIWFSPEQVIRAYPFEGGS